VNTAIPSMPSTPASFSTEGIKLKTFPSTSVAQQQTAGIALAIKRGERPAAGASEAAKSMAKMPTESLLHYAKTKHGNLPQHVKK
jgi:hypothetical protein